MRNQDFLHFWGNTNCCQTFILWRNQAECLFLSHLKNSTSFLIFTAFFSKNYFFYPLISLLQRHARFRKKLFDSSHTIRGIHLGQDRFKRRYFVLPNAGGIYVEGLESGCFDENVTYKTKEEKEERKEHLDNLLTSLKSPTSKNPLANFIPNSSTNETAALPMTLPKIELKCENFQLSKAEDISSTNLNNSDHKTNELSSNSNAPWFSLHRKEHCESFRMSVIHEPLSDRKHTPIVPPKVRQLCDDRNFLESVYSCYSSFSSSSSSLLPVNRYPLSKKHVYRNSLLGELTLFFCQSILTSFRMV